VDSARGGGARRSSARCPVLVAKALWLANGVWVYATILRVSRWCYSYFLVRRGGRVHKWWLRHDGGIMSAACACTATASKG
jgi:hypothetical protein